MRKSVLLTTALLAACSPRNNPHREQEPMPALQTSPSFAVEEDSAAPGVNVTAAPGVAFDYRYAFRLPGNRIAQVQEAHAQACEKLGIDRCRITGMRYRLVDQKDVQAMLALRLDPKIARQFGKDATGMVEKADGMLIDQEIRGEDVGSRIRSATKSEAQLRDELQQIEADLANLSREQANAPRGAALAPITSRREELRQRADSIREQLRALSDSKDQNQEALSGTPMVFNYGSGNVVPGFDVRSPLRDALQQAWDNFVGGFAAILVILITLVPWILVLLAVVWAFRFTRRQWGWFAPKASDSDAA